MPLLLVPFLFFSRHRRYHPLGVFSVMVMMFMVVAMVVASTFRSMVVEKIIVLVSPGTLSS